MRAGAAFGLYMGRIRPRIINNDGPHKGRLMGRLDGRIKNISLWFMGREWAADTELILKE
jgi:hypothetical protein